MEDYKLRYLYNKTILNKLLELCDKHRDFRFIKLLWACGIIRTDNNGEILDDFYEESTDTWKRLCESYFVKDETN